MFFIGYERENGFFRKEIGLLSNEITGISEENGPFPSSETPKKRFAASLFSLK